MRSPAVPPAAPSDPLPVPVTVKGVCRDPGGRVLLCRNHDRDWELPGGRPEQAEAFPETLRRELREETGLCVHVGALLSAEPLQTASGRAVAVLAYACEVTSPRPPVTSPEHAEVRYVGPEELATITLPDAYRRAIAAAPPVPPLFHLALRDEYDAARAAGAYLHSTRGLSRADVGFVHLAYEHQLTGVAERFYDDVRSEVLVLRLDPLRLAAPVVLESVAPEGEAFPHLYGALPLDAVVAELPLAALGSEAGES